MSIDLTAILQALIGLLAALITYRLIPWLKEHTTAKQRMNLCAAANIAVFAAVRVVYIAQIVGVRAVFCGSLFQGINNLTGHVPVG